MQPLFKEIRDLKVCILSEKLQLSQNMSSSLREFGIMPVFFDSIHSFWSSCLHQKMDLAIVDNALLESAGVSLKDHPRVKNKQVNIVVAYEEPSLIRTDIIGELHCLGLLHTAQGLSAQIGVLLQQAKQVEDLRLDNLQLVEHRERLRHRNSLLVKNFEDSQKFCDEFMFMQKILEQVDNKLELGFSNALETVFNELSFVKKFFIVGVSSSKRQLVSLSRRTHKSYKFQNLYDENLELGIHDKALERILVQAQDQLGGDIIPIRVFSELEEDAQLIIVLSVSSKSESLMPWRVFEEQLSARYNSLEIKKLNRVLSLKNENLNPQSDCQSLWELAQKLDTNQFHISKDTYNSGLIEVHLAGLISLLDQNTQVRFSWSDFYRDFQLGLSRILGGEVLLLENGIKSFIIQVDQEQLSQQLVLVDDYCEFFEYWRYFSDSHIVMSSELIPRASILANTTKFLTQSFAQENTRSKTIDHSYKVKNSETFSFDWESDFAQ